MIFVDIFLENEASRGRIRSDPAGLSLILHLMAPPSTTGTIYIYIYICYTINGYLDIKTVSINKILNNFDPTIYCYRMEICSLFRQRLKINRFTLRFEICLLFDQYKQIYTSF